MSAIQFYKLRSKSQPTHTFTEGGYKTDNFLIGDQGKCEEMREFIAGTGEFSLDDLYLEPTDQAPSAKELARYPEEFISDVQRFRELIAQHSGEYETAVREHSELLQKMWPSVEKDSEELFKKVKELKAWLDEKGYNLKLTHVYEVVAKVHNFPTWNHMKAKI